MQALARTASNDRVKKRHGDASAEASRSMTGSYCATAVGTEPFRSENRPVAARGGAPLEPRGDLEDGLGLVSERLQARVVELHAADAEADDEDEQRLHQDLAPPRQGRSRRGPP